MQCDDETVWHGAFGRSLKVKFEVALGCQRAETARILTLLTRFFDGSLFQMGKPVARKVEPHKITKQVNLDQVHQHWKILVALDFESLLLAGLMTSEIVS